MISLGHHVQGKKQWGQMETTCAAEQPPKTNMSNVQNPYDIPLYWLVNRDPYNGPL